MKSELQINLIGPLTVMVDGKTAVFRTDAERVLLIYLAAHQGTPQRRDTLAGLLSPDRPDKEALTYLRNRLTRLRKVIGDDTAVPPFLDIDRKQIALRSADNIRIDSTEFDQHLTTVETHPHRQLAGCPTCMARLETAVSLVRGDLLAGLNFPSDTWEAWLIAQREHVQQRALESMTWLREAQATLGEWTAVLEIAQRQLSLESWLESAHRAIMTAHHHLGNRAEALAQFEQCQAQLWEELGVEPEPETEQLRQKIANNALFATSTTVPDNLPLQTSRFIGREAEQRILLKRLVDPTYRLVTLVGAGGMGKTRLSIEVGMQIKNSFPDGVWFVPLEAVKDEPEQIKIAIGEAIQQNLADKQLTGEQVLAILRDKHLLLIFDNCETVLDALAFIPDWLRRAPQIAILATSREPLNFQTESLLVLDGLPIGHAEAQAAEALFGERAGMARADFALSPSNLPTVRQICTLVDGSPLGISLAAAWVRQRSLPDIVDTIQQSLDFLSTRFRDVEPRHRSMRAVFETSWQLLTLAEQDVLAALSVFPESFTAVSATDITGATVAELDLLCEKSLLQFQSERERYQLHTLVRQFSAEKLGRGETPVDHAFINHFYFFTQENQLAYSALQPEWGNFSAAIAKAHALKAWQRVLDFVQVLDEPWFRQIRFTDMREGLTRAVEAALTLQDKPTLAKLLLRLGEIEIEQNDYDVAETHLTDALILTLRLGDRLGLAQANYLYGRVKSDQGADEEALNLFEAARDLFEDEKEPFGVAKSLNMLAVFEFKQSGNFEVAQRFLEQSIQLQKQRHTNTYIESLRYLARVKSIMQDFQSAEALLIEAATISQEINDLGEYAAVLFERLALSKKRQQFDQALVFGRESLETFEKLGSLRWEGLVKTQLGLLYQTKAELHQGLVFLLEGLQIFQELGDVFEQAYSHYYLYKLYEALGETEHSLSAKKQAQRLNLQLNNPRLAERLK